MSSEFFLVKYLTDVLDKCSLKLFGYETNEFIEMHFSDIFRIIEENENSISEEKSLEIINKVKNNQFNLLNYFEYIKNLRNYLETNMINEFNKLKESTKTNKLNNLINIENKLNFIVNNLKLSWNKIKNNNLDYFILNKSNLKLLLSLNDINSDDITEIEWKDIISDYMKKTTLRFSDHIKLLRLLQTTAEKYKDEIKLENKFLKEELFKNLNKLCIRHNNEWDEIQQDFKISTNEEYYKVIKKTFQLFLLAMIIIDN
ncbi:hypothetical protein [Spiroplasma phoeniceum]|nr:hypothetical protein [Spiroplasma phoeniceum]